MPNTIVVNVPPYEGEYEIDLNTKMFTYPEWRWVKKISGYMPLTINDGWEGGDPDLVLALAVIAMYRAGKIAKNQVMNVVEAIEDAEVDGVSISVKLEDDEEVDDSPPVESAESTPDSSPSDSTLDSGDDTSEPSVPSPESTSPSGTGLPGSDTGAESAPLTLAQ